MSEIFRRYTFDILLKLLRCFVVELSPPAWQDDDNKSISPLWLRDKDIHANDAKNMISLVEVNLKSSFDVRTQKI